MSNFSPLVCFWWLRGLEDAGYLFTYIYVWCRFAKSKFLRPTSAIFSHSGFQCFALHLPLFSILTSFEDRWEKRPAPCLRFSRRTSGSSSGNDTLLPWPQLRPRSPARLFATNRRWRGEPKPSHVARSCAIVWPQKTTGHKPGPSLTTTCS